MTTNESLIFMAMVFVAVVLLAVALIVPTAGSAAQASRRMRSRIGRHLEMGDPGVTSLIREHYLKEMSPFERQLEEMSLLSPLSEAVEQSGLSTSTARILMQSVLLFLVFFFASLLFSGYWIVSLGTGLALSVIPIFRIMLLRNRRIALFEEQLPEALNIMGRALKAGHPFSETLNMISEEMPDPISSEFGRVFSDMNFGLPMKTAMHGMLTRIPSMSLHTVVTAVVIQSESGGKLADILQNVSDVIRGRFKLQRKLKTLSAEGRMSAWVLGMVPMVLAAVLMIISPDYLPVMLEDPRGIKAIGFAFLMMCVGILWMRKIIRIDV